MRETHGSDGQSADVLAAQRHVSGAVLGSDAREALDALGDAVFIHDPDSGVLLDVNAAASALTGLTREELIGADVSDFSADTPLHSQSIALQRIHQAGSGEPQLFEWLVKHRDGSLCPVEVTLRQATLGEQSCVVASVRDISSRDLDAEHEQSRHYLETIIQTSHDGIFVMDADGRFEFGNEAFLRILDWPNDELLGERLTKVIPPDLHDFILERWREAQAGRGQPYETDILTKSGARRSLAISHRHMTIWKERKYCGIIKDMTEHKAAARALADSESNFRALADNADDGILIAVAEGRHVYANERMAEITGYTVPELLDTTIMDLAHPDELSTLQERYRARLRGETVPRQYETLIRRRDGTSVPIELTAAVTVWLGEPGDLVVVRDITKRREAEAELTRHRQHLEELVGARTAELQTLNRQLEQRIREHEQAEQMLRRTQSMLSQAQRIASTGSWEWDPASGTGVWSEELYRIVGIEPTESGLTWKELLSRVHPGDRDMCSRTVEGALAEHLTRFSFEPRVARPDGGERTLLVHVEVSYGSNGEPVQVVGTALDITERKRMENALRRSHGRLRSFAARLEAAREAERRRLAHVIHDQLGHELAALKMGLASLEKALSKVPAGDVLEHCAEQAHSMSKAVDQTIQSVRELATDLRPPVLDLGLAAAIEWQAQTFEQRTGIACTVDCGDVEGMALEEGVSTGTFRVCQETLTNVAKHASAARVEIRLEKVNDGLVMSVRDDGRGIKDAERMHPDSLGLLGMEERARLLGGTVEIRGGQGGGTVVTLRIPGPPAI